MQELIKISPSQIDGKAIQTVNARELWEFLESGQDFSDWIKARIEQYSFDEGRDFTVTLGKSTGGRPAKDYHISLNMAKELGMAERTNKGKMVRLYFIECEKKLLQVVQQPTALPNNKRLAMMVIEESDRADRAEAEKQLALEREQLALESVSELVEELDLPKLIVPLLNL